jgi:hypothetical protein
MQGGLASSLGAELGAELAKGGALAWGAGALGAARKLADCAPGELPGSSER